MTLTELVDITLRLEAKAVREGHDPKEVRVRSIAFSSRIEHNSVSFTSEHTGSVECDVSFSPYSMS